MTQLDETLKRIKKSRDYLSDPENREYIADIERDLESLKTDAAFQKLDQIKMLRARIKSVIYSCRVKLMEEDNPQKRLRIKADRDSYTWLLHFFSRDTEKELQAIEDKLEERLS